MEIPKSFLGYKRENGRVGTRNHVVILPVDDISNACAEAVANNIKGTFAIPHAYGRLQFGADLELFFDDHLDILSTAFELIISASSNSFSALSTSVYAAQLMIISGFKLSKKKFIIFRFVKSNSEISEKNQL